MPKKRYNAEEIIQKLRGAPGSVCRQMFSDIRAISLRESSRSRLRLGRLA